MFLVKKEELKKCCETLFKEFDYDLIQLERIGEKGKIAYIVKGYRSFGKTHL